MQDRGAIRLVHWAGVVPTLSSFPVMVFAYTCHQNVGDVQVHVNNLQVLKVTEILRCSQS